MSLTGNQYLIWVKESIGLHYDGIIELGDGYAYCKMLHMIHPTSIDINMATPHTVSTELLDKTNWDLISAALLDLGIEKELDVLGLVSMKSDINTDFLRWFYETFSGHIKGLKCLEAANKVKQTKQIEMETAIKVFKEEEEKLKLNVQQLVKCKDEKKKSQGNFDDEETKLNEAKHAITRAIEASEKVKETFEKTLSDEMKLAANNTKSTINMDEIFIRSDIRDGSVDPLWFLIDDTLKARDNATDAIKDYAEQHAKAIKTAEENELQLNNAVADLKDQTAKAQQAKRCKDLQERQLEKAVEAVRQANFAIAVLKASEHASDLSQGNSIKDAVGALRRVETTLDGFTGVRRTSSNLRVFRS